MRLDDTEYYDDAFDVPHTCQGDVYRAVPLAFSRPLPRMDQPRPRGSRKRPLFRREDEPDYYHHDVGQETVVVCNYTCTFIAQPPGTTGYAHHHRFVAPLIPMKTLAAMGYSKNELHKVCDLGGTNGLMYAPLPDDEQDEADDEWSGAAAVCVFRLTAVSQELLDARERVARFTKPAQRILMARLVQQVYPELPQPDHPTFPAPDRTNGWSA